MGEVDSRVSRGHYGWLIVAALFTVWMVVFGIQYSFGIFFRSLQDALGCSRGAISWTMTLHLIVFALFMVPSGWAVDHVNMRPVLSVAALLVGIPLVLCSRVSEPWQLYLLYGLQGVGISVCGPPIPTIVARWFTKKRGLALGLTSAGSGFGTLVAAPLTSALIASYGWRNTFVILGLTSVVILLVCAQFVRNPPEPASNMTGSAAVKSADRSQIQRVNSPRGMTFRQAMKTREIMFIIAAAASAQIASRLIVVHIAPHATDIGISTFAAAMALSTIGFGSFLGRIAMGLVQDKIGAQRSLIICLITMGVCLLALPFITSDTAFFVFAILFGLAYGGDVPQVPALTAKHFGMASMGIIYALVAAAANIACSLGPLAAGYIFDVTQSYTISFLGAGVLLLLGASSIFRLK